MNRMFALNCILLLVNAAILLFYNEDSAKFSLKLFFATISCLLSYAVVMMIQSRNQERQA